MKSHYEDGELDRKETIARLVKDVDNWDLDRLRCYARECVERDLQLLTGDDLIDQWLSEMDSDQLPRFTYGAADTGSVTGSTPLEMPGKSIHRRAS